MDDFVAMIDNEEFKSDLTRLWTDAGLISKIKSLNSSVSTSFVGEDRDSDSSPKYENLNIKEISSELNVI